MTPIQACKETKELWTEIARIAREENKAVTKWEVPGPWEFYRHNCPCCEYITQNFDSFCPMYSEWAVYISSRSEGLYSGIICEDPQSPYEQWLNIAYPGALCIDVEFFCLLIAEMAEEAKERNIAESQPRLAEDKDVEYV